MRSEPAPRYVRARPPAARARCPRRLCAPPAAPGQLRAGPLLLPPPPGGPGMDGEGRGRGQRGGPSALALPRGCRRSSGRLRHLVGTRGPILRLGHPWAEPLILQLPSPGGRRFCLRLLPAMGRGEARLRACARQGVAPEHRGSTRPPSGLGRRPPCLRGGPRTRPV